MSVSRQAAALIATILMLLTPAAALAGGGGTTGSVSRLSSKAPSWLAPSAGQASAAQTTTTSTPAATPARGTLPRTGLDLLPEVLAGALLLACGAGLRVALRLRRA